MLTCVTLMTSIKFELCWLPKAPSWIHMKPWLKIAPVLLLGRHYFGKGPWCSPYLQLINPSHHLWLGCAFWYPPRGEPSFQAIKPLGEFWVRQIDIFNFGGLCWNILVSPKCRLIFHWPKKKKKEKQNLRSRLRFTESGFAFCQSPRWSACSFRLEKLPPEQWFSSSQRLESGNLTLAD